jgi:hypothetical protein
MSQTPGTEHTGRHHRTPLRGFGWRSGLARAGLFAAGLALLAPLAMTSSAAASNVQPFLGHGAPKATTTTTATTLPRPVVTTATLPHPVVTTGTVPKPVAPATTTTTAAPHPAR